MSRMFLTLGGYEAGVLWRFLDGVSTAVSARMVQGSSPGEENLTFLLCELLDANTTSLHVLRYPLSQAKSDLEASDAGVTVDVEFETHEHSKHVESRYSGADLGIVLTVNHPVLGHSRRGILVQAKRLIGSGSMREYRLNSDYRHFDRKQAEFLEALRQRFGVYNSVFYLWYNPPSTAFQDDDAKILRAYEAAGTSVHPYWHQMHPLVDELIEIGLAPWPLSAWSSRSEGFTDVEGKARAWRHTQPALRLSALDLVLSVANNGPPHLKALYDAMEERRAWPMFSPFADFLLVALASSRYGSDNPDWIRLTEGQKVRMPASKQVTKDGGIMDEIDSPPTPRHTLRLTVRSTLPQAG
ncbi:MAG: hypothetical protein WD069_16170 [Planctomycetales bacterium]